MIRYVRLSPQFSTVVSLGAEVPASSDEVLRVDLSGRLLSGALEFMLRLGWEPESNGWLVHAGISHFFGTVPPNHWSRRYVEGRFLDWSRGRPNR